MNVEYAESPCRWAAAFKDEDPSFQLADQFVDLSPKEQVARGQELLRLLWEPVTPCTTSASSPQEVAIDLDSTSTSSDTKAPVLVKNTFIELAPEGDNPIRRTRSDSAICVGGNQCILNLMSCLDEDKCQKNISPLSEHFSESSQLERKVSAPRILDLSACLDDQNEKQQDALATLSNASTGTPREVIEDISIYDVPDSSLVAPFLPEGHANVLNFDSAVPASCTYSKDLDAGLSLYSQYGSSSRCSQNAWNCGPDLEQCSQTMWSCEPELEQLYPSSMSVGIGCMSETAFPAMSANPLLAPWQQWGEESVGEIPSYAWKTDAVAPGGATNSRGICRF